MIANCYRRSQKNIISHRHCNCKQYFYLQRKSSRICPYWSHSQHHIGSFTSHFGSARGKKSVKIIFELIQDQINQPKNFAGFPKESKKLITSHHGPDLTKNIRIFLLSSNTVPLYNFISIESFNSCTGGIRLFNLKIFKDISDSLSNTIFYLLLLYQNAEL